MHRDREIHDRLGGHEDRFGGSTGDGMVQQLCSQSELNDLIHDLNLPKDAAEVLGSRFKAKNLLSPGINFLWYRHREGDLVTFPKMGQWCIARTSVD
jgi:hypothetical protein